MVSRRVLLTSRWGYYLQIDQQQNVRGVETSDEYCGKIDKMFAIMLLVYQDVDRCSYRFGKSFRTKTFTEMVSFLVFSVFEMETIGFAQVTVRGVQSNAYIAINDQGNLYTTVSYLK